MKAMQSLCLVITLIAGSACSTSTNCCPEICVLDNERCVRNGSVDVYASVVGGLDGVNNCLEPLFISSLDCLSGSSTYKLTNILVTGISNGVITKALLDPNPQSYQHYVNYPKLVVTYEFETTDELCNEPIHAKVILTACDYEVLYSGTYGVFVNVGDNLPHFYIQDVCAKVKLVGEVQYCVTATCCGTPTTVNRPVRTVLRDVALIMKRVSEIIMTGINKYTKMNAMGKVLPANDEL